MLGKGLRLIGVATKWKVLPRLLGSQSHHQNARKCKMLRETQRDQRKNCPLEAGASAGASGSGSRERALVRQFGVSALRAVGIAMCLCTDGRL